MHGDIVLHHDEEHRWCLDCHDTNNRDQLQLASGALVPFTESYRLCGQCHGTQYRDWRERHPRQAHGLLERIEALSALRPLPQPAQPALRGSAAAAAARAAAVSAAGGCGCGGGRRSEHRARGTGGLAMPHRPLIRARCDGAEQETGADPGS